MLDNNIFITTRHKTSAKKFTTFGTNAWVKDLPAHKIPYFLTKVYEYEIQGLEPPYWEIRRDTLLADIKEIEEHSALERAKKKKRKDFMFKKQRKQKAANITEIMFKEFSPEITD